MRFCSPLTRGIYLKSCEIARGGFKALYAANVGQLEETGITADEVVSILMRTNPVTADPYHWFPVDIKKDSGSISNPAQIGTNNRNINQVITFDFEGFSKEVKARFEEFLVGDFVFIAVMYDDTAHMVGRRDGARMTTGDLATGLGVDDFVGVTIEMTADGELEAARSLASGVTIDVLDEDGTSVNTITL